MTLDNDAVVELIERLDKDSKAIKDEALRFTWYMRGGLSYEDAIMLCQSERDIVSKIIKENLEIAKTSGMPFF